MTFLLNPYRYGSVGEDGGVTDRVVISRVAAGPGVNAASTYDVVFDTEVSDASNYWTSGSPGRLTVPTGKAGYHFFTYSWAINQTVATARFLGDIRFWNSSNVSLGIIRAPIGEGDDKASVSGFRLLADGDYVTFHHYRSNASWNLIANGTLVEAVRFA